MITELEPTGSEHVASSSPDKCVVLCSFVLLCFALILRERNDWQTFFFFNFPGLYTRETPKRWIAIFLQWNKRHLFSFCLFHILTFFVMQDLTKTWEILILSDSVSFQISKVQRNYDVSEQRKAQSLQVDLLFCIKGMVYFRDLPLFCFVTFYRRRVYNLI